MLRHLSITDIVLVDHIELDLRAGLSALTGETGAGKSIILDSLGLATGGRTDAGLIRSGSLQGSVTAEFDPPETGSELSDFLEDKGLALSQDEPILLRRVISRDGRSKSYVNDQPVSLNVLKALGSYLLEVHGQHDTAGLLDARRHGLLLDDYAGTERERQATLSAYGTLKVLRETRDEALRQAQARATRIEDYTRRLEELDRLDPREGEEALLATERGLLGASERALEDISEARTVVGGDQLSQRLSKAFRALDHARTRAAQAGAGEGHEVLTRLTAAAEALDRTLIAAEEALGLMDAAALALDVEPGQLDRVEERLFALRGAARKMGVLVDDLPRERARLRQALAEMEDAEGTLNRLNAAIARAEADFSEAVIQLRDKRVTAAKRLGEAVMAELKPLRLEKARFRAEVRPLELSRHGPGGGDQIIFEVQTNPGAEWGGLHAIASGGELARFALALKAALARRATNSKSPSQPVMIFDEVDQGVGGAVADAVGLRLKALAVSGQVIVVTHSPQVAARADQHLKVSKSETETGMRSRLAALSGEESLEELARMLAGAEITPAARAAALALKAEPCIVPGAVA